MIVAAREWFGSRILFFTFVSATINHLAVIQGLFAHSALEIIWG